MGIPSDADLSDSQNLFLLDLFEIQFLSRRLGDYNPVEIEGLVKLGLVKQEDGQFRLTDSGRAEATRLDSNRSK
jgi:hypothetical protein